MKLDVTGGALAYEVSGSGPLVVLAHGLGDSRQAYRFVVPALIEAGYRVAAVDLRGCGESTAVWDGYTRTDIAQDLIALISHLGGPAVLVGHSISGGAATIAAAQAPSLVTAVVEIAPFTLEQKVHLADLKVARFRSGTRHLLGAGIFGSRGQWRKYLEVAYPDRRPADWDTRLGQIDAMLREPGRMRALQQMVKSKPTDAAVQLANVGCPVLVIEGSLDPDWASPEAEGRAIMAALPTGLGHLEVIAGAGHYPHAQYPQEVIALVRSLLTKCHA